MNIERGITVTSVALVSFFAGLVIGSTGTVFLARFIIMAFGG